MTNLAQPELPGIPASNSLAALREREQQLERQADHARKTFATFGYVEPGFADLAEQLCALKKEIAAQSLGKLQTA